MSISDACSIIAPPGKIDQHECAPGLILLRRAQLSPPGAEFAGAQDFSVYSKTLHFSEGSWLRYYCVFGEACQIWTVLSLEPEATPLEPQANALTEAECPV